MNITLKPLTAIVTMEMDTAVITVINDSGKTVIGPLKQHMISSRGIDVVNDHLRQLKFIGLNIVNLKTKIKGVRLD